LEAFLGEKKILILAFEFEKENLPEIRKIKAIDFAVDVILI
jgi:hypothetical protein